MWRVVTLAGLGLGLGCGDNLSVPADAPAPADAPPPPIDARVDAVPADAFVLVGRFVIDRVDVPTTVSEAGTVGLDLDGTEPGGDAAVDNQLGNVLAAVVSAGFDVEVGVAFAIDHGDSITLMDFPGDGTLHTYAGIAPIPPACGFPGDLVCRQHLLGTGSFDRDPTTPTGVMPITSSTPAETLAGPGTAIVDITLLGNPQPLQLELLGARFAGSVAASEVRLSRLAGMVSAAQIDADIIPAVANAFRTQVADDCGVGSPPPGCGCPGGTNGELLIGTFDTDQDCTISDDEVRQSSLIMSLLAPDVTIDGVDGLSFGIGIHAVPATFRFTP